MAGNSTDVADGIAIVGLAGRFPGAANVAQFWRNLCDGIESVSVFTDDELEASGIDTRGLPSNYVKARAILDAADWFDAAFFGFNPREAEILDPQQRVFLESAWEALEDAGCDPERFNGSIGVFAGMANNSYYLSNLQGHPYLLASSDAAATMLANEKDYLATRTSYKLNLKGPSLNINTACSTSLVAVCQACQSLLSYQCDAALAGGVAIDFPQKKGTLYQESGITSADGHCRAFDERATGMVPGNGVGVVLLRRLSEALADGDHVYAVIRGFAVNNDGAHKVGYTAPSVEGQAEAIALAQAMAAVNPETITYVEAHGTGTPLGDPIEIAGLTRAFKAQTNARGYCAIGSAKTNIGHLDAAAGIAGLIKTVLALRHGTLPPSLNFTKPNPKIDFAGTPFFVNDRLRDWNPQGPRRAGVSSFGIGGTNAHVVLEEAPVRETSGPSGPCEILALSAKSPSALAKMSANLADYLRAHPDVNIADVAYTLQLGRRALEHRQVFLCSDRADALRALEGRVFAAPAEASCRSREVAELWLSGAAVDWRALHAHRRQKVPLPTYPFERQRYWVAPIRQPSSSDGIRTAAASTNGQLVEDVRSLFQELSGLSAEQMSAASTIAELGLDSLALAQASLAIERRFGVRVGFRELQESLADFKSLAEHLAPSQHSRTDLPRPADGAASAGSCRPPAPTERVELTAEQNERSQRLIDRYTRRTARSKTIAQENRAQFADPRAAAGFRQAWKEMVYPIVVERSSGARLHDVDGNEYIDLVMGFGVNLFGHSPDFVNQALQQQLGRGVEIGPQSPLAGRVATAICRLTGAERATFCNTGSEAVLAALRIARATTNRDKVVLFAGSYHGILDEVLVRAPSTARSQLVPIAAGIPPSALANVHVLDYGDPLSLDFIAEHGRELAAVLVEPVQSRNPELQPRDFLRQLRSLTEDHGVALIFDEIITGFRCHPGGAQSHFGVRADIATYGKVLGGGMPIGVVAGKSQFLDALDGGAWRYGDSSGPSRAMTYFAGTFVRHPLAIAAADAVLQRLEAEGPKLQENLNERTENLAASLRQMLAEAGLPLRLGHFASLLFLRPTEPAPLASLLFYELRSRGIHLWEGRPGFLSTAHTDEDLATIESAFAASIAELTGKTAVPVRLPPSTAGCVTLPMTPAQTDLWIAANMGQGASLSYNLSYVVHFRGPLAPEAMRRALQDMVDRHEALRTTFDAHGRYQFIWDQMALDVPLQDVSALPLRDAQAVLEEIVEQSAWRPFDLEKGPLFRAQLVRVSSSHHALLLTAHHLVLDGSSFGVVLEEIGALYKSHRTGVAASLPLPLATRTYTRLEQEQRSTAEAAAIQEYWLKQFISLPDPLELPSSRPRLAVRRYTAATERFVIGGDRAASLRSASGRLGCGLTHLLLAGFSALLHRLSASDDFVVGAPATSSLSDAGLRIKGDRSLVGDHVNLLPLRVRHSPEQTFEEHVRSIKVLLLDGYDHQNFNFSELVNQLEVPRAPGHVPLVPVTFNVDRAAKPPVIDGVETEVEVPPKAFDFYDLSVNIIDAERELCVAFTYNTDLFDAEVIHAWLAAWRVLLEAAIVTPGLRVVELPLVSEVERRQLLTEFNTTAADYPHAASLHELFEAQAAEMPDAVAVVFGNEQLPFGELNKRANRLAHRLGSLGVGPDACVGLCVEPSLEMVIGLLGILKAGGAYVPLDPTHPEERRSFVLQDAKIAVLLIQERQRILFQDYGGHVICIDAEAVLLGQENASNPARGVTAQNLAHVLYTSGSTGSPKGVAGTHQGAVNRLAWMWRVFPFHPGEVGCQKTALTFIDSVWEVFSPLLRGVPLVVLPDEARKDPERLLAELSRFEVSRLALMPSLLRALLDTGRDLGSCVPRLRYWFSASEALPSELCRRFSQLGAPGLLVNLYGCTEAAGDSTCYQVNDPGHVASLVPIGRPIDNTQVHVLDTTMQLLPVGVVGELYIGGDGLARGYLSGHLTAEKFVPDPFNAKPDARLYRTGDLARWRTDGNLELLGRRDRQVKLRGFRIELEEIEAVLNEHPSSAQSVVVLREDRPGDTRLVAYCVPAGKAVLEARDLTRHLRERLPDYMIPSVFVPLEALPLTSTGKIDRRALPPPDDSRPSLDGAYAAPRNPIDEQLSSIWSEVLGIDSFGIHDNFFAVGGHSLLAARVAARVSAAFEVELPLRKLFEAPTIAELAAEVRLLRSGEAVSSAAPLERVDREQAERLPLSFAQQRLWFLEQMEGELTAYNIPFAWRLRGPLNVESLRRALEALARRHEPLRTTFAMVDGEPVQIVGTIERLELPLEDLRGLAADQQAEEISKCCKAEADLPFDLTRDVMLRASLLCLSEEEHVLLLTLHHIASDGWSLQIFWRELAVLYRAYCRDARPGLPHLSVQYTDHAVWQRKRLEGERLTRPLQYWREQLQDLSPLELPTDRPRPVRSSYRGARHDFTLRPELARKLKSLGQAKSVTLHMTLLAAYQVLLSRYSGQEDIAVATPVAGRNHAALEDLIGFFVNTLVLRTNLSDDPTFRELLARVRQMSLAAYDYQDLPFEKLVEDLQPARHLSRSPLVQALFQFVSLSAQGPTLEDLEISELPQPSGRARFDLEMHLWQLAGDESLRGRIIYSTDLFEAATIERLVGHFLTLLEGIAADADQHISALPLLTKAEREQLLMEWNDTAAPYPQNKCVHQLFEEQVDCTPAAIALVFGEQALTYRELNERANQLAHHLRGLGVGPETLVGLCLHRSPEMMVGILGVLKAGGAYVPLDAGYPAQRLAFMLANAKIEYLVTEQSLLGQLPATGCQVVCLDTDAAKLQDLARSNPSIDVGVNSLAYVIFTSGSTGQPKGVATPHRSIARLVFGNDYTNFGPDRVYLQLSTVSFDASTFELWGALLHGAKLVIAPAGLPDFRQLEDLVGRHRVTTLFLTTTLFNQVVEHFPQALRGVAEILTGGEVVSVLHIAKAQAALGSNSQLIHVYGPTEGTTFTTYYRIPPSIALDLASIPIGAPIANTQVYVLDKRLTPVPVGVPGELYIGGAGLARGYLNRPELTTERFVANPFSDDPQAKLYRTGDLCRWHADGNLEFLRRLDEQIKLRGFRIELGEIEAVLKEHPSVAQCVVVLREDRPGDKLLVAYCVPAGSAKIDVSDVTCHLRDRLPDYMVPSAFVPLEALPLTSSSKIDRRALPAPAEPSEPHPAESEPRDLLELGLLPIWRELFGRNSISTKDSFFDLGGHSLLAVRLATEVEKRMMLRLPIKWLFEAPTIHSLANLLREEDSAARWASLVPMRPRGRKPPLFLVHGYGGVVWGFVKLVRCLATDQPVYGLQAIDRFGGENRHTSVEEMAACYVKEIRSLQPDGPYYLGGHSLGGWIAYETAQQLARQGQSVQMLALFDTQITCRLPTLMFLRFKLPLLVREKTRLRSRVRYYLGWSPQKPSDKPKTESDKPKTESDKPKTESDKPKTEEEYYSVLVSRYRAAKYVGSVDLFASPQTSPFVTRVFRHLARGGAAIRRVAGSHLSMILEEKHVQELAGLFQQALQSAQECDKRSTQVDADGKSNTLKVEIQHLEGARISRL
jgi:amino acid adenylation domain-containing protein